MDKKKTGKSKNGSDLEKLLSKGVMPVLASILIFVGLGSFAYLVFDNITEPLKCFAMFLFSFILFGFGLFKLKQEESNFSLALSACGTGTVYVSLIVSRFYFGYLNETWLFNLMTLWSGLVYYLACLYKSNIFSFISYIGLNYAVYLALKSGFMKPYLFLIFAAFSAVINYFYGTKKIDLFYYKNRVDKEKTRFFYFVANLIMFVYFSDAFKAFYEITKVNRAMNLIDKSLITFGVMVLFASNLFNLKEGSEILVPSIDNYDSGEKKISNSSDKFIYVLFGIGNLLASYFCVSRLGKYILSYNISLVFGLFVSLALICFYAFFIKNESMLNIILLYCPCIYFFGSGASLFSHGQVSYPLFLILALVVLFTALWSAGAYINKRYFKYMTCLPIFSCIDHLMISILKNKFGISYFSDIIGLNRSYILSVAICILFVLIVNVFLGIKDKLNDIYILISNWFLFILAAVSINFGFFSHNSYTELFISLFLTTFLLVFQLFYYDLFRQKKELFSVFNVINNLTLVFNVHALFGYKNKFLAYFIILILSLAQYISMFKLIDLIDYEKNNKDESIGYWIGLKSTFYFYGVLHSILRLNNMPYVYSIIFISVAVLFIIFGQKINLKSLRLYGLWMTLILVFKLLMIDISYKNSIGRVFSLIFSGLLCFAINFIYNKVIDDQDDDNNK